MNRRLLTLLPTPHGGERTGNVDLNPYGEPHYAKVRNIKMFLGPNWDDYVEIIFNNRDGLTIRTMGHLNIQPNVCNSIDINVSGRFMTDISAS